MSDFNATYANQAGEIFESVNHRFVCCSAHHFVVPEAGEMIPLPEGSTFVTLPELEPLGWNPQSGAAVLRDEGKNELAAVSVILPPGYIRLLLPGTYYHSGTGVLPARAYTAVAYRGGEFWVPAVKVAAGDYEDSPRLHIMQLNSTRTECYLKPGGSRYRTLDDVLRAMTNARERGDRVLVELLVFPGVTDQEEEMDSLLHFTRDLGMTSLLLSNIAIDPRHYLKTAGYPKKPGRGVRELIHRLVQEGVAVSSRRHDPEKKHGNPPHY